MDPSRSGFKEFHPGLIQDLDQLIFRHAESGRKIVKIISAVQDVLIRRFPGLGGEIPPILEVVHFPSDQGLLVIEDLFDLGGGPGIELPLLSLAVGVFGGVKSPLFPFHVPENVGEDLAGCIPVLLLPGCLVSLGVDHGHKSLVVEHLFIMGQQPLGICGITMEAESNMVVDASHPH